MKIRGSDARMLATASWSCCRAARIASPFVSFIQNLQNGTSVTVKQCQTICCGSDFARSVWIEPHPTHSMKLSRLHRMHHPQSSGMISVAYPTPFSLLASQPAKPFPKQPGLVSKSSPGSTLNSSLLNQNPSNFSPPIHALRKR